MDYGYSVAEAAQLARGRMFLILREQAAVLAYSDVFLISAGFALAIVPLALMLTGEKVQGGGGH